MISTPETGVDSIAITWALLDPVMTIIRPVAAFFTASLTGFAINIFDHGSEQKDEQQIPVYDTVLPMATVNEDACCSSSHSHHSHGTGKEKLFTKIVNNIKTGMSFSFGDLLSDIGPWLLFGVGLAAIISVFLSPEFIHSYMGSGFLSMLIMLFLATPLYVCATASTPIAAALALKGLSPGAALVFLLAGPATNIATITVVAKLLGKKVASIYVVAIMCFSLLLGMIVNWLYFSMGLSISNWVQQDSQQAYGIVYSASAVILLLLIGKPWIKKLSLRISHIQSASE